MERGSLLHSSPEESPAAAMVPIEYSGSHFGATAALVAKQLRVGLPACLLSLTTIFSAITRVTLTLHLDSFYAISLSLLRTAPVYQFRTCCSIEHAEIEQKEQS